PSVVSGVLGAAEALDDVGQEQYEAHAHDPTSDGRQHVHELEPVAFRVGLNTTRNAEHYSDMVREEEHMDADPGEQPGYEAQAFVHYAARELREPVVQGSEESHKRAATHDVVEVRHDEVGVVHLGVERGHGYHDAGDAAQSERDQERDGVQDRHRE